MAVVGAFDTLKMIRRRLPLDEKNIKEVEDLVKSLVDKIGINNGIDKNFEIEDVLETFVVVVAVMLRKKETRWFIKGFIIRNFFPRGFVLKKIKKPLSKFDDKICKHSLISRICSKTRVASSQGLPGLMPTTFTHGIEPHVGMDDEFEELVSKVVEKNDVVISIWGVAGLGKTTMARKIYDDQRVRKGFDAFAWVFFSQGRDTNNVLLNILNQFSRLPNHFPNETPPTTETMIDKLKTALGKRKCLIVLDNIQDMDQWNQLIPAFEKKVGKSVILLTTREESFAKEVVFAHELRHLNEEEGWNLLKKYAFKKNDGRDVGLFRRVGKEMVQKCEYLPSSIIRLGTILSNKTYWCDWQTVGQRVSEYIEDHKNEGDEKLWKDLDWKYTNLPFHLKEYFLYLGHFNKDDEIDVEDLYFLWIAEGMVTSQNEVKKNTTADLANEDREKTTLGIANEDREETAQDIANEDRGDIANEDREEITPDVADEEIAEGMVVSPVNEVMKPDMAHEDSGEPAIDRAETYITELASRKMVQVVARSQSRFLRSHARELSSWDEGFRLQIIDFSNAAQSRAVYMSFDSRARRLAIDFNKLAALIILIFLEDTLRSLFLFNSGKESFENWFTFSNFGQFKLLRVLNFVRCKFDGRKLPEGIDRLLNLRYLGLLYCDLAELPLSIGNLINLRVLNVRVFEKSEMLVPNDFLRKLVLLSHLRLPYHAYREKTKKLTFDNLIELETLFGFNSLIHDDSALSKLPKLRRLRAHVYNNDRLKKLLDFIESNKKSIRIDLIIENKCDLTSKDGEPLLVELLMFSKLHALTLSSVLISKIPNYEPDISSKLAHLKLIGCRIQEDPMKVLGKFPNLEKLYLGYGAYVGSEMNVSANDDFPKLAYLEIHSLRCFEKLTVAEGAMRNLSDVIIRRCPKLKLIPGGLESISNLKNLEIELAAEAFVHVSEEEYRKKFPDVSCVIRRYVPLKDQ